MVQVELLERNYTPYYTPEEAEWFDQTEIEMPAHAGRFECAGATDHVERSEHEEVHCAVPPKTPVPFLRAAQHDDSLVGVVAEGDVFGCKPRERYARSSVHFVVADIDRKGSD